MTNIAPYCDIEEELLGIYGRVIGWLTKAKTAYLDSDEERP